MGDRGAYKEFIHVAFNHIVSTSEESDQKSQEPDTDSDLPMEVMFEGVDLHLVDSMNVSFEAYVFHACLGSLDGQPFHSIGVTEDGYEIFTTSPAGLHCPPYD